MKPQTIERYIRYSTIPYIKIVERTEKKGWIRMNDMKYFSDIEGTFLREIEMQDPKTKHTWTTCFPMNDTDHAVFNMYSWSKSI